MTPETYRLIGTPRPGGILVVGDHASNRVPEGIRLGVESALMTTHIAVDIGIAGVAEHMAAMPQTAAFLGNVSRLVCDFNREEDAPGLIPITSDGHAIPGNRGVGREHRLARFHRPYHAALAALLAQAPPALIVSLHSFTPALGSDSAQARPWQVGVLYNQDDRAARLAIPMLQAEGLTVGDQQPYSGRILNATMNRHAEAPGRPYLGLEVRQDQIDTPEGRLQWAELLYRISKRVAPALG